MPNILNIHKGLEDVDREFKRHIEVDPISKCWLWKPASWRFRHAGIVFNPRHYAMQMEGYVLEKNRNYKSVCANDKCVNPAHAALLHNGRPPERDLTLYLDIGTYSAFYGNLTGNDFQFPNGHLAKKYHVSKEAIKKARNTTLDLIVAVKQSHLSTERLANEYRVAPGYIKKIKELTLKEFQQLEDFNLANENIHDESEVNSEGLKFKRRY